jgi:hypothetical protein
MYLADKLGDYLDNLTPGPSSRGPGALFIALTELSLELAFCPLRVGHARLPASSRHCHTAALLPLSVRSGGESIPGSAAWHAAFDGRAAGAPCQKPGGSKPDQDTGAGSRAAFVSLATCCSRARSLGRRYTNTGVDEWVRTLTVWLPSIAAESPRRPCDAITTRSHPFASEAWMIA